MNRADILAFGHNLSTNALRFLAVKILPAFDSFDDECHVTPKRKPLIIRG
jgi:hypothetical protein